MPCHLSASFVLDSTPLARVAVHKLAVASDMRRRGSGKHVAPAPPREHIEQAHERGLSCASVEPGFFAAAPVSAPEFVTDSAQDDLLVQRRTVQRHGNCPPIARTRAGMRLQSCPREWRGFDRRRSCQKRSRPHATRGERRGRAPPPRAGDASRGVSRPWQRGGDGGGGGHHADGKVLRRKHRRSRWWRCFWHGYSEPWRNRWR